MDGKNMKKKTKLSKETKSNYTSDIGIVRYREKNIV